MKEQQQPITELFLILPTAVEHLLSKLEAKVTEMEDCEKKLKALNDEALEIDKEISEKINNMITESQLSDGTYTILSNGVVWKLTIVDGFLDNLERAS